MHFTIFSLLFRPSISVSILFSMPAGMLNDTTMHRCDVSLRGLLRKEVFDLMFGGR